MPYNTIEIFVDRETFQILEIGLDARDRFIDQALSDQGVLNLALELPNTRIVVRQKET